MFCLLAVLIFKFLTYLEDDISRILLFFSKERNEIKNYGQFATNHRHEKTGIDLVDLFSK
jgi:hypothetical protein